MKLRLVVLAVFAGAWLTGCGEPGVQEEVLPLEEVSQEIVYCRADCPSGGYVDCSGNTCNAVNGSHVTCDGNTIACPTVCNTSTTCPNGNVISCHGAPGSCSNVPGRSVTCDNVTYTCPCTYAACSSYKGSCPGEGIEISCCWSPTEYGYCACNSREYWMCGRE